MPATCNQRESCSWISLGIALALTMLVQGCLARFSGYIPSGLGTVERRYCAAGIKDGFQIQADSGVEILIWVGKNTQRKTIRLDADLIVPEGIAVQVLLPEFIFQSDEWTSPRTLPVYEITAPGPRHYKPAAKLNGAAGSLGRYSFWFLKDQSGETGLPEVNSFTLQFPPLLINEKVYRMVTVKFEAYTKWSVYMCAQ